MISILIKFINKSLPIKTIDIGSGDTKEFLFVKKLDQITGFKLEKNIKLPFKDETIEAIYCSHTIEHLFDETIKWLLIECHRVLKKGGALRIVTIDFKKLHHLLIANKTNELLSLANFRGRPEWKHFGITFSETKFVTHFFSNYQNRKYEQSPEFGYNQEGFYRGPPNIEDKLVKKMANKLSTRDFGKWLVNQIPKEYLNFGGHVNPIIIETFNEIDQSFNFMQKEFCNSTNKRLIKMEKYYNDKRKRISIFFEATKN